MELKFIWIKKYKNIEETGFNFNHSEGISFKYVNDELIIEKNQYNTPKGFFKNNITGLTAIVGKNGSGKTNLSEFINFNLAHVTNGGLSMYFSGYKGILIIDKYIFNQEDLPLKNRAFLEQLGYIIYDYKDAPLDKQNGLNWS